MRNRFLIIVAFLAATATLCSALTEPYSSHTRQTRAIIYNAPSNIQFIHLEVVKLVEAFLKIKGEFARQVWILLRDNGHIITALRDTLISKISTIHNLTLKIIIVVRRVLEFAGTLFGPGQ